MPLNEEIKQTATNLGLALAASPELQELMNLNEFDAAYDRQIEVVKALFTRSAVRLSTTLGVKYTDFAR
jgi:hypothetical protein